MNVLSRFICTFSVAHVLYLSQSAFLENERIQTVDMSIPFWNDVLETNVPSNNLWIAGEQGGRFESAIRRLGEIADAYMEVGRKYALEGRMSEQIHR